MYRYVCTCVHEVEITEKECASDIERRDIIKSAKTTKIRERRVRMKWERKKITRNL